MSRVLERAPVLRLRHRLSAVHAPTGIPLEPLDAELLPPVWRGWILRVRGHEVLLSSSDDHAEERPAETRVRLRATSRRGTPRLGDRGGREVTVSGEEEHREVRFPTAPMSIELRLLDAFGAPVDDGRRVRLTAGGEALVLEEADGGVYRNPSGEAWRPSARSYDIRVSDTDGTFDDRRDGEVALDFSRRLTRVTLVLP